MNINTHNEHFSIIAQRNTETILDLFSVKTFQAKKKRKTNKKNWKQKMNKFTANIENTFQH